jgi:hypothetical protein
MVAPWNGTGSSSSCENLCTLMYSILNISNAPEPEFINLLRSPGIYSQPGGPVRHPYLTYRPARLHRLAESILWLLKHLQISALVFAFKCNYTVYISTKKTREKQMSFQYQKSAEIFFLRANSCKMLLHPDSLEIFHTGKMEHFNSGGSFLGAVCEI